jgi:hypothetical protein
VDYVNVKKREAFFFLRTFLLPSSNRILEFTDKQLQACQALYNALIKGNPSSPDFDSLLPLIHQFFLSFVQHKFTVNNRRSTAIVIFVYCSAIAESGDWDPPHLLTPRIAALTWTFRIIIFWDIFLHAAEANCTMMDIMDMSIMWVKRSSDTVFTWFRGLTSRTSSFLMEQTNTPFMDIQEGAFTFRGHRLTFEMIREFVLSTRQSVLTKITAIFARFSIADVLSTDFGHLIDDLSNHTPGYSFMTENPVFSDRDILFRAMMDSGHFHRREGNRIFWNVNACVDFMAEAQDLVLDILAAMQTTCGGVPRGTEVVHFSFSNTSSPRNIYWWRSRLLGVSHYHKGLSRTEHAKNVPHAYDTDLSRWVVLYLWLIRRVEYLFAVHVFMVSFILLAVSFSSP